VHDRSGVVCNNSQMFLFANESGLYILCFRYILKAGLTQKSVTEEK